MLRYDAAHDILELERLTQGQLEEVVGREERALRLKALCLPLGN
jgi:hypothetical protein